MKSPILILQYAILAACSLLISHASFAADAVTGTELPEVKGSAPASPTLFTPTIDDHTLLSRAFEERAMRLLERYIPRKEVHCVADITPSGKALPKVPYDPQSLSSDVLINMEPEDIDPYVGKIELEIQLSKRVRSSKAKLEDLLQKGLKLKRSRGDRLKFGNLGIEVAPDDWDRERTELKNEISRLRQELRSCGTGGGGIRGKGMDAELRTELLKVSDLRTELKHIKDEHSRLIQEVQTHMISVKGEPGRGLAESRDDSGGEGTKNMVMIFGSVFCLFSFFALLLLAFIVRNMAPSPPARSKFSEED